ncbi:MAG: sulfatase-like hydrolase/transferase [Verrucomicrobiales bacterium]|nr:sulfatase-like hydrolase/transferase [Verrucomicrobiales bacterium]
MKRLYQTLILLTLLLSSSFASDTPNIVLIFADDLGYGDLSCYGATKLKTPNIDRLAEEGRKFTDAHSASAVCTPSRYALVTGEYPHRRGLSRPVFLKTGLVIDTERQTIADLLKDAGYATACIGKWHLGFGKQTPNWNGDLKPGPLELGFDYYFGVPVVNSHPPFVYVENHRVVGLVEDDPFVYGKKAKTREFFEKMGANQIGGADAAHALYDDEAVGTTLTEKSVEWIKERGKDPFFLFLSTTNIHHPFTPAPRFQGTSECGPYGDFVHELDWMVGEVMKTLEEQGVADNTLVIFTSDNGGMFNVGGQNAWDAGHRLNGELLGFKFGAWEGGHRVPFIARWPGQIEAGSTSDQLISNIDLMATFAALAGGELKQGQGPDSVNVLPALTGDPENPLRDHLVLSPSKPTHLSIRKGKWMYIGAQGSGGFTAAKRGAHAFGGPAAISYAGYQNSDIENGKIKPGAPPVQLYDLEKDPQQTTNLYNEHPEVVEELRTLLKQYAPTSAQRQSGRAVAKYDEFQPLGNLRFTFETGKLEGWTVVEGQDGPTISGEKALPKHTGRPFNRQGKFHLTTIATRKGFTDEHQAVFQSPPFVIEGSQASFLASGGFDPENLYIGLVDGETKEVLCSAGGAGGPQMKRTTWDVSPWKGKTVYLEVVDRNTEGWGHLTFDDFSVKGKLAE